MRRIEKLLQRRRFNRNRRSFWSVYHSIETLGPEPFVAPFWQSVNEEVAESFKPMPEWGFLGNRALRDTMFVVGDSTWLNAQIKYLEDKARINLKRFSEEDSVGEPKLLGTSSYRTSHNSIHHLYHMFFYLRKTNQKPVNLRTVVEWGGGYGNFAKLWKRSVNPASTYVIIDTALFCSIQWLYLVTVLGKNEVQLLDGKDSVIAQGKINLVPLALLDNVKISGDLFVSTWGLSESMYGAQDYVVSRSWFDCPHLLIGFQNSTNDLRYASRLGELSKKAGATIIDIDFIPNNHYAFK